MLLEDEQQNGGMARVVLPKLDRHWPISLEPTEQKAWEGLESHPGLSAGAETQTSSHVQQFWPQVLEHQQLPWVSI